MPVGHPFECLVLPERSEGEPGTTPLSAAFSPSEARGEQGGYQVTSSGLSDGTLRIFALTILPYLPIPPAVLVHEEPENGVHPRAIEAILQGLTGLHDSQVWISTHSPVVLAQTDVSNVLCARIGADGAVEVVSGAHHPRLKDWQGGLDLGSLFAAGVLE